MGEQLVQYPWHAFAEMFTSASPSTMHDIRYLHAPQHFVLHPCTFVRWGQCRQIGQEGNCGSSSTTEGPCLATAKHACALDSECVAFSMRIAPGPGHPAFTTYLLYHDLECVNDQSYSDD